MLELPENINTPFLNLKAARQILEKSFPDFTFRLDGKLIGDIGEALIKYYCPSLVKLREESHHYNFKTLDEIKVQVKTTQEDSVSMGNTHTLFDHFIVLRLYDDNKFEIIFDEPDTLIANLYIEGKKNINLNTLRDYNNHKLMKGFSTSIFEG